MAIRQWMALAMKKTREIRLAMGIARAKWIRSIKTMPSEKPNRKPRKKWNAAWQNQESISTLMQVAVMVVAEVPQGTAVATNLMITPRNLNTYRNVVGLPNELLTKAMAVTEVMVVMATMIAMKTLMQLVIPIIIVSLALQEGRQRRMERKCRR